LVEKLKMSLTVVREKYAHNVSAMQNSFILNKQLSQPKRIDRLVFYENRGK